MTVWTLPRRDDLRSLPEGASKSDRFDIRDIATTVRQDYIDFFWSQTPSPSAFTDVVVASDRDVSELVSRSLVENADVWRRLADL